MRCARGVDGCARAQAFSRLSETTQVLAKSKADMSHVTALHQALANREPISQVYTKSNYVPTTPPTRGRADLLLATWLHLERFGEACRPLASV